MARVTKTERNRRVLEVCEWIINGVPDYKIHQRLKDSYGIKLRQCRNYIKQADEKLKPQQEADIETKRNRKILEIQKRVLQLDVDETKTAKGLSAYINAQKLLIKLENIEPVKKIQFENDKDNPFNIVWKEEKVYTGNEPDQNDE